MYRNRCGLRHHDLQSRNSSIRLWFGQAKALGTSECSEPGRLVLIHH